MRWRVWTVLVFLLLFANIVSANFNLGNESDNIYDYYARGSYLRDWINISFENQSLADTFKDSLGNEVPLGEVLNSPYNSNYEYSCVPTNCESYYVPENYATEKTYSLDGGDSVTFAVELNGEITSVDSVFFYIKSNAPELCKSQIMGYFGDNQDADFFNIESSNTTCSDEKETGCFDPSSQTEDIEISTTPICQRMTFQDAPLFKAGAFVKEVSAGTKNISMSVYDSSGNFIVGCTLPKEPSSPQGTYVSCSLDLQMINSLDLYLCISATDGTGTYTTRKSLSAEKCGFEGIPPQEEDSSYDIFIQRFKFGKFEEESDMIKVDDELYNGKTISGIIEEYLNSHYGGLDCTDGCVFPIKIDSLTGQNLSIGGLDLIYTTSSGQERGDQFVDLKEVEPRIDSDFQKLYLNGAFELPNRTGEINYSLELGERAILRKVLSIDDVYLSVTPLETSIGTPTRFTAEISSELNVTNYTWNFLGIDTINTTENSVEETFSNGENAILDLEITTSDGKKYQNFFLIALGQEGENLTEKINSYLEKLDSIENFLSGESQTIKQYFEDKLDIAGKRELLNQLKSSLEGNASEETKLFVTQSLSNINIPDSIYKESGRPVSLAVKKNNINLDNIQKVTYEEINYSNEDFYLEQISNWAQKNVEVTGSQDKYSLKYGNETIFDFGVLNIELKNLQGNFSYFIVDSSLIVTQEGINQGPGFYYTDLPGGSSSNLIFFTEHDISITDLPFFVTPTISSFSKIDKTEEKKEKNISETPWKLGLIILFAIIIISAIAYVLVTRNNSRKGKTYYPTAILNLPSKRKPEILNQTDLQNLLSYIRDAKNTGLRDFQILEKLEKTGWKRNQIDEAFRRFYKPKTSPAPFRRGRDYPRKNPFKK